MSQTANAKSEGVRGFVTISTRWLGFFVEPRAHDRGEAVFDKAPHKPDQKRPGRNDAHRFVNVSGIQVNEKPRDQPRADRRLRPGPESWTNRRVQIDEYEAEQKSNGDGFGDERSSGIFQMKPVKI